MTVWAKPESFSSLWDRAVATRPDARFLTFEASDGTIAGWTYSEFDAVIDRTAALLVRHGVDKGASVHLALQNCPLFVSVWLAASRLGAWIVPSDPLGRVPELADHIERTLPRVGFCAVDRAETYRAAGPGLAVVEVDERDAGLEWLPAPVVERPPSPPLTARAAVMFTSGTTGRPKGVEVTQANYAFAGEVMGRACALSPEDRQLVVLPLFHANAQYYSFASAIWAGASVALMAGFSASGFLGQAVRHEATCASLFAAPMRMILARGEPTPGVRLRHCWYAQNVTPDQYQTLADWFGCRPRQLYGMTETIPAVLTDDPVEPLPHSMGLVTPGCSVDIQDAGGRSVEPDEEGEVVVGGQPGLTLFAGYLDDPSTTAASFRDGWFRTGDRATRDNKGRHYFAGRRSDILKVAGENVSTVEVEGVLAAHPQVLEASVVGAPDELRDEVPVAFVVARDPASPPSPEDLVAWCEARLAKSKIPRRVTLLDELPRTSVGKIRKFVLTDAAKSNQS